MTAAERKVLLMHDPPVVDTHSSSTSSSGDSVYDFLLTLQCPVVLVLSDVSGRDDFFHAVERCLPRHIRAR